MKISVIGCGYLGAVHAASMAEIGHTVVGIDVDKNKVDLLSSGTSPFVEPGFDEILARNVDNGRLTFSTDYAATADADIHFIGVGTPQKADGGAADMTYVHAAVDALLPHVKAGSVVVGKSTVPVGTAASLEDQVVAAGAVLVWNPEFLREGFAVQDTLEPDRLVYGLSTDPDRAIAGKAALDKCYEPMLDGRPRLTMDFATAELVKVSANSFLATKISFINAMSQACDAVGADVTKLARAIGLDDRIGSKFLRAGIGFGGGCLPKDIRAFHARANELGIGGAFEFLSEVEKINTFQRTRAVDILDTLVDGLAGKRIAVLGASFKPDSDDIRQSPSIAVAKEIAGRGASVVITDPAAGPVVTRAGLNFAEFTDDIATALKDADGVFLGTEWKQFRQLDPAETAKLVHSPVVVDGRNALDPEAWKAAGWTYRGIGRR